MCLIFFKVMETKDMLYIVTEFAKNGEMFGKSHPQAGPHIQCDAALLGCAGQWRLILGYSFVSSLLRLFDFQRTPE
jgi:hypothetical protein